MASLDQLASPVGGWLKREFEPPNYCREEVTVKSGEVLADGHVVSLDTGKYVAYDQDTNDAKGILIGAVDATAGDQPGVVLVRGPAIVSKGGLTWDAANDAGEIAEGLADLLVLGIVARESA